MKEDWSADTVRIVYITINIWQPLTCYHGHIFGVENSCETELEVVVKKKKKFRLLSCWLDQLIFFYLTNIIFLNKKIMC
jgi:hypothetical protein